MQGNMQIPAAEGGRSCPRSLILPFRSEACRVAHVNRIATEIDLDAYILVQLSSPATRVFEPSWTALRM